MELNAAWRRAGGLVLPLLAAAGLGSLLAAGSFVGLMVADWPSRIQDPLEPLILVFMVALFALPAALVGLLVLGVPAALVLWDYAEERWMPFAAMIAGAVLGQGGAYALDFHRWGAGPFSLLNMGTLTGAITGYLWYRFAKPRILSVEKD